MHKRRPGIRRSFLFLLSHAGHGFFKAKQNLREEMRLHRTSSVIEAVRLEDSSVGQAFVADGRHVMSSRIATFFNER